MHIWLWQKNIILISILKGNKNLIRLNRHMKYCLMIKNEKSMINISILITHNHNLQVRSQIRVQHEIIRNNIKKIIIMQGQSINMNSLKDKEKCIQDIMINLKLKIKGRLIHMMIYSRTINGPNLFMNKLKLHLKKLPQNLRNKIKRKHQ